jgi:hypothetical protein
VNDAAAHVRSHDQTRQELDSALAEEPPLLSSHFVRRNEREVVHHFDLRGELLVLRWKAKIKKVHTSSSFFPESRGFMAP